jgi:hypothetical protein
LYLDHAVVIAVPVRANNSPLITGVLVGVSGGLVPDLPVGPGLEPVRFLPLLPMTPNEAAWKRVHGAEALEERWLGQQLDLRDPARPEADLA